MGNLTSSALRENKYCRICLKTSELMRPLFVPNKATEESCSDILEKCASTQLQQDSRLSSQACLQCVEVIYKLRDLKKMCETSNELLGEILSKSCRTEAVQHESEGNNQFDSMDDDEISTNEVILPVMNPDNYNIKDVDSNEAYLVLNSEELTLKQEELDYTSESENEGFSRNNEVLQQREASVSQSDPDDKELRKKRRMIQLGSETSNDEIAGTLELRKNNSGSTADTTSKNTPIPKVGCFSKFSQISSSPKKTSLSENIRLQDLFRAVNKNTALLNTVLQSVEDIRGDVNRIFQMTKIKENFGTTEVDLQFKRCTSTQQLRAFNVELEEEEFFNTMVAKFTIIGGKDYIDSTRRLMGRILTNDLAKCFNWKGRNNKHSFQEYVNINKLILATIRSHEISKTTTQQEVEDVLKVWLRGAQDRDGGRTKRKVME